MKLVIVDGEGRRTVVPFGGDELAIGRSGHNQVRLGEKDVSRRHARLVREDGAVYVEDLGSFTGVRVNGEKVHKRRALREGDAVQISAYSLSLDAPAVAARAPSRRLTPPVMAGIAAAGLLLAVAFQRGREGKVAAPAEAAPPASSTREAGDAESLLAQGNEKLRAQDVAGALALFERAASMEPPKSLRAALYRGMGEAYLKQGNLEQGARYYRLYLPLCDDAQERARVQQLLDDSEAGKR